MSDELIFTHEEFLGLTKKQIKALLQYYGIDLSEISKDNFAEDAWGKIQEKFPGSPVLSEQENISVRVKRIMEANRRE